MCGRVVKVIKVVAEKNCGHPRVVRTNTLDHSDLVVNVGNDQIGLVVVVHASIRKENSPARVTASGIYGIPGRLSHRLANTEQVSFAISEPCRLFSDTAAARVVAGYLRNAVDCREARQIVLLEYHTARPQLRDGRLDVVNLPCQLSVIARRDAGRFEQGEPAVPHW
jgi:hypothetical protein